MATDFFRVHLASLEFEYERLEADNIRLRRIVEASTSANACGELPSSLPARDDFDVEESLPAQTFQEDGTHWMTPVVPFGAPGALVTDALPPTVTVTTMSFDAAEASEFASETTDYLGSTRRNSQGSSAIALTPSESMHSIRSFSSQRHEQRAPKPVSLFPDAEGMKAKVRAQVMRRKYDVADYYKGEGKAQFIARHQVFEFTTLCVIFLNAVWIAIDTDYNRTDLLVEADAIFQIGENCFCVYFLFEILVRFAAFEVKRNCLGDVWFVFDACLVVMMVLETWVIVLTMRVSGSMQLGNASVLRIARLFRLSRMARLARLLRAMPELVILIKGMVAAARSVFFTLLLLLLLLYVFAIAFTQLMMDTDVGKEFFPNVAQSMNNLWLYATLLEEITHLSHSLLKESLWLVLLLYVYILAGTLTVLNMLVGVLCEVVSAVASSERESVSLGVLKSKIERVFYSLGIDDDRNGMISRQEFDRIIVNREACRAISELGVDVVQLLEMADYIFTHEDDEFGEEHLEKQLSFEAFMDILSEFRGKKTATVKDIMQLRKFVQKELAKVNRANSRHPSVAVSKGGTNRASAEAYNIAARAAAAVAAAATNRNASERTDRFSACSSRVSMDCGSETDSPRRNDSNLTTLSFRT